jgi:iron complex outermembrane receptor protein
MKIAHLIIAALLSISSFAHHEPGASTFAFSGQVTERGTTETLSGVKVSVKGTDIFTFTDREGNFKLENLPVGQYELEFTLVSFSPQRVQLNPTQVEGNQVVISLDPR